MSTRFTDDAARRIARQVPIVERRTQNRAIPERARAPSLFVYPGKVAKAGAGGVAALSGSTPGTATVTLYTFDGTTLAAGATATAYNLAPSAVAANAWIMLKWVDGYWFVDYEACPT
jgi:hypothetical protein